MHALLDCINEASMLSSHAYGVIQSSYRISPRLPSCLGNPTLNFFATWDKLCATKLHPFLYPWTFLEAKRSKQRIYFSFWPIVELPLRRDFVIHRALHPFNTEDLSPLAETLLCLVPVTSHWRACCRLVCGFSASPLGPFLISECWAPRWAWFSTVAHP